MLKFDGIWFAVKEVAMSAIIGIALLATMRSKESLVRTMLFNETVMDVDASRRPCASAARRPSSRSCCGIARSCSPARSLPAADGFASPLPAEEPGGTPEFNASWENAPVELAVLVLPAMAMMMVAFWRLLAGLRQVTG